MGDEGFLSDQVQHQNHNNDSRYRRFESMIDKNLGTFETISEWADIIAFLSRLNKVYYPHIKT